jgi:ketohexokinase
MARILLVGTATLDLVFGVDHFPHADEEMRAQSLQVTRGGNAANSAVVLSQMGHQVEFLGVLADAAETTVIAEDFARYGVVYKNCPRLPGKPPTSSIYLTGNTRSIVHYRDLPELSSGAIRAVDLQGFDWVHFEGRNVEAVATMMRHVRDFYPGLPISLELEKPRQGLETLYCLADMLICSRNFDRHRSDDQEDFLSLMQTQAPQARIVLAAGERGAYALDESGAVVHAPALAATEIVDTLGAGDTFNAALLNGALQGLSLSSILYHACNVAGRKCGISGLQLPPEFFMYGR